MTSSPSQGFTRQEWIYHRSWRRHLPEGFAFIRVLHSLGYPVFFYVGVSLLVCVYAQWAEVCAGLMVNCSEWLVYKILQCTILMNCLLNCLRRICGISLRDHVPNVDILNRCDTLSVESQLQGKRLRWLGHVFRMPNDRLPKKLLFGQVKGLCPPGCPRSSFNDVALHDCQTRGISTLYRDVQDRLLWKDKTCPART